MRVIVLYERSGQMRRAFRALGHEAYSVDIEPSDDDSPFHLQSDAFKGFEFLGGAFDLVIAHPPCTYFTRAGRRWLFEKDADYVNKHGVRVLKGRPRLVAMEKAADEFNKLKTLPVKRIAIENPRPHDIAAKLIGVPSQVVQPWQFGHADLKATGFWLYNLPELIPTRIVTPPSKGSIHQMPPSKDRTRKRSETFSGIAAACSEQWGSLDA